MRSSNDMEMNDEELEAAKKVLRQNIRNAQSVITMEANQWEKQVDKGQSKTNAGMLTNIARTHLKASANMSHELLMRQLAVITGALEDMLHMSRHLGHAGMRVLENWTAELVSEMAKQKEAVNDAFEELGDRTKPLLTLVEERKVIGGETS